MVYQNSTEFTCNSYVHNLTSSYVDKSNESSVLATSVIMFVLSAVFFNLNLFSRVSDVSAVLNPTVRLVLSTSLSLFLPVMSYLFSEAKNAQMQGSVPNVRGRSPDLPLQARLILTWMLLVELLRKKVEAILVSAGAQPNYASIVNNVTSVLWLGYLVFFNLKAAGQKAVFGILWVFCATKLVQRVTISELGKRSLAYGKNARLVSSYMAQMLKGEEKNAQAADGSARLRKCKYVVMGEEKMVLKAGPHGYKLDLSKITKEETAPVTVGKIWNLPDRQASRPLKSLCLSFALFKLLRRKFELLPATTKEETNNCRDLIFEGFCKEGGDGYPEPEVALFQMINDEVNFLTEYYHSVHPVMFASPYFFLVNYFVVPVVVFGLCTMTVILCSNGNMSFAFTRLRDDNYVLSFGIIKLTKCLWKNVLNSTPVFFSIIDISISYLLFLAFLYEEVWEFIIFVLSNWFSVSLLCTYAANPRWHRSATFTGVVRRISWVRKRLSQPTLITCKQFSVLQFCWLSLTLPTVSLPKKAKRSIMKRLKAYVDDDSAAPLSNGRSELERRQYPHDLLRFCESDSVAEVILIWHIATSLLEMEYPQQKGGTSRPDHHRKVVATRLSKYCAYLVTFHPELLPDDKEGTKRVYKDMKKALKEALGWWGFYFLSEHARYKRMTSRKFNPVDCQDDAMNVVRKGIELGKELTDMGKGNEEPIWKLLAHLWVELIVYVAPSGGDEQVKGHEEAQVQGSNQLVTLLWTLTTHTGITRSPGVILPVENVEEEIV